MTSAAEQGRQEEYDRFWDAYQQSGNRTYYTYAIAGAGWNDETFKPKYPINGGGSASCAYIFAHANITRVDMDFSTFSTIQYLFYGNDYTTWVNVIDLKNAKNLTGFLHTARALVTIEKIISYETSSWNNNSFQDAGNLTNVTFDGVIAKSINFQWQSKLTDASVQSIIDHLMDLTGTVAQNLTLHKDVGAKLTDEQKAAITARNWILVY